MDCVQVVESLSQREKNSILHVLQRDEKLRIGQERKISMLKEEIHIIRLKGILRSGDDQAKMCIRCRCEFGLIFNRGSLCPLCRFKICKLCQEVMFNGSWLCKLCYKQRQLKWLTGEWSASFEENPLRKWASGSDLVKGSFQIFTGASSQDIDIDDVPSQTSNNNHSKQSARTARNGHLGPAESGAVKQRVEYPKDADQNRLSHLFDVLRTNRPDRDSSKELQVKRVSSRRYSESDSDSSSSSDREETSNRGSPLAPSITESEHDDRRGDSPRGIDSPRGPDSPRKLSSVSEERDGNIDLSKVVRPKPAPRSPRPTQKTFADDTEVAPKPKPREKRKHLSSPNDSHESRLKSEHLSQVSASRSVDNILGHTLAPEKDRRNRKALSHTELHSESVGRGLRDRSLESLHATAHKSSEHLGSVHAAEKSNSDDQIRRSADNLNTHSSADQNIHDNYKLLGAKVRQDIAEHRQSEDWSDTKGDKVRRHSSDKKQEKDDDIELQVPRAGSPYSCSMDSLPSSHPSPTPVHSLCDSSLPESSDTDSLSRHSHTDSHTDSYTDSHTEVGELSSTESVQREGSEDDYVVEEISKVRFQRVSKKVAQIAMVGKMNRSPRKQKFSSRSSPQTISEGSTSQDDSGLVSGGSWGPTPEHKRTDSGYSQSSLPSTLSTVTDKSEDEDIDRMFASAPRPRHGNLLSVVSDSRESIASYYSDAGDIAYSKIPVSGEILFGLNYNYKTGMLEIAVKQCRNIAAADSKRNRSDPYVKTYLLPDKTRNGKRKTKVKKHTLSPTFDETLKYVISKSELENRTLWVTVWHNDRFGRNDFLGEVTINFDYYKFDEPFPKWYLLQERLEAQPTSMMTYKGDLSLTILYVPPDKLAGSPTRGKGSKGSTGKGQLHVTVKEARNLTAVRSNGFSDTFCKGYLLPERHRSSKQKTQVIKKDCSPTWDHTFVFEDVTLIELRERCLELTIWDYEKLASNDFLGGTRLNLGTGLSQGRPVDWMDARGEEMSMWQAMLDRPNISIDGALILRPNMEKRKF